MKTRIIKILLSSLMMMFVVSIVSAQQPLRRSEYIKHRSRAGESISSILKIYNIPLTVVSVDNPEIVERGFVLKEGYELYIRKSSIGGATAKEIDQQIKLYKNNYILEPPQDTKEAVQTSVYTKTDLLDPNIVTHYVESQETLYSISKKYNVPIQEILERNPDISKDGLKAGSVILIRVLSPNDRNLKGSDICREDVVRTNRDNNLSVVMLLPLSNVTFAEKQSFISLYKGALIALDSLKRDGLSANVDMYDTARDPNIVDSLLRAGRLNDADLIIGPVYNESFSMVARFAQRRNIPIVSPLLEVTASDGVVVQMTPYLPTRYEKLNDLLSDVKIVYFNSASDDKEFLRKVSSSLKGTTEKSASFIDYNKFIRPTDLLPYLSTSGETVFVVSSINPLDAEMIMSKITALKNSYPTRNITVLASPSFAKCDDVKKSEFFKVETRYITSYHSDRINEKSYKFEKEYIKYFNERPTMMSYRGYDIMMIFLSSMHEVGNLEVLKYIDEKSFTPLQVKYSFFRQVEGGKLLNEEWPLVIYKTDKTIIVK